MRCAFLVHADAKQRHCLNALLPYSSWAVPDINDSYNKMPIRPNVSEYKHSPSWWIILWLHFLFWTWDVAYRHTKPSQSVPVLDAFGTHQVSWMCKSRGICNIRLRSTNTPCIDRFNISLIGSLRWGVSVPRWHKTRVGSWKRVVFVVK